MTRIDSATLCALLALILVSGCSRQDRIQAQLQRAEKDFAAGRYDRAEIEYLNVVRLDPANPLAIRHLGLMAYHQGRLGPAYAMLGQARKLDPDDFEVRLRLAQAVQAGGDADRARIEAVMLLAEQPANEDALRLLVECSVTTSQLQDTARRLGILRSVAGRTAGYQIAWGLLQLRAGSLSDAETSLRNALALDPESSAAHVALGNLHAVRGENEQAGSEYQLAAELAAPRSPHSLHYVDYKVAAGEFQEAKAFLERLIERTADYLPAQTRLAQIALKEGRLDECDTLLRGVLARDRTHLDAMLLLAELRLEQEEPGKTVAVLKQVLEGYPRLARVHYQLAQAHLKNDNHLSEARGSLNQALELQPDFPGAVMLLAELDLRQGSPGAAIGGLTRLVEQHPELPGPRLLLATAHRAQGELDAALKVYADLGERYPSNPQIPLLAGLVLQQQGRPDAARTSYERALALAPGYPAALEHLVTLDLSSGRFEDAKQRVQQSIERDPAAAGSHFLMGRVHFAETNLAAAEQSLLEALEIAPDFGAAQRLLARTYVAGNKQEEALQRLNQIVAQKPDELSSWWQIAQLHRAASNHTAAKDTYEKILSLNSDYVPALNNLAWVLSEHLGDLDRGYELATRARRLQPNDAAVADTLGWILYQRGDYARSLALIRESAGKHPEDAEVQFHLGMVCYMVGQESAATSALQSAVHLGGQTPWAPEALQRLRVLEIDPARAGPDIVEELERWLSASPNDPVLLTRLGRVFEHQASWEKAAATYEKALNLNSNLVVVLPKLARLYTSRIQNPQRALALAQHAYALEPENPEVAHVLGKLVYRSAKSASDYEWAFNLLQKAARLSSDSEVIHDCAWAAFSVGKVGEAVGLMQQIADSTPASPRSEDARDFLEMNRLLSNPEEMEASVTRVQERLRQRPDDVPALMVLGRWQERSGEWAAARDSYERALSLFPLFSPAHARLATLYFGPPLSDPEAAYRHAGAAREAFPEDASVARILGLLEFDRGSFARAVQLLAQSAPQFPSDGELLYRLGLAQYNTKAFSGSKQSLTRALGLAPASPHANEAKRILAELP